jgi:cell division transport system permease protein
MLLVVKVIGDASVDAVKKKVDINLYVSQDSSEEYILSLKSKISDLTQVESVKYVSKDEAIQEFKKENINSPEVIQALRVLGRNPLSPSLVIKPKDPDNMDGLINELNKIESPIIESRNFATHKEVLEKIKVITERASQAGIGVSIIFIFITLLVVYNAVRVAIYTHNQEITIMRLVGASGSFIYIPFVLSSVLYTLMSTLLIISIFFSFLTLLQPYLATFFVGYNINILNFFLDNFVLIFGTEFAAIAFVNILASLMAIRKYAKA